MSEIQSMHPQLTTSGHVHTLHIQEHSSQIPKHIRTEIYIHVIVNNTTILRIARFKVEHRGFIETTQVNIEESISWLQLPARQQQRHPSNHLLTHSNGLVINRLYRL